MTVDVHTQSEREPSISDTRFAEGGGVVSVVNAVSIFQSIQLSSVSLPHADVQYGFCAKFESVLTDSLVGFRPAVLEHAWPLPWPRALEQYAPC